MWLFAQLHKYKAFNKALKAIAGVAPLHHSIFIYTFVQNISLLKIVLHNLTFVHIFIIKILIKNYKEKDICVADYFCF